SPTFTLAPALGLSLASSLTCSLPSASAPLSLAANGMGASTSHRWTKPSSLTPDESSAGRAATSRSNNANPRTHFAARIGEPPSPDLWRRVSLEPAHGTPTRTLGQRAKRPSDFTL